MQNSELLFPSLIHIPSPTFAMDEPVQRDHSTHHEKSLNDNPNDVPKRTPDILPMPCGHQMNGRNLIVCIDGTANQFGTKVACQRL